MSPLALYPPPPPTPQQTNYLSEKKKDRKKTQFSNEGAVMFAVPPGRSKDAVPL